MWLYFNKNANEYKFELSRVYCEKWGIKKDAYYHAVKELTDKGFLIPIYEGSNVFLFHERAVSDKPKTFSENPIPMVGNQKKVSENTERNNTNNTENTIHITEDDDIADGDIVDCGNAAIPKRETYEEKMERWFGTYRHESTYESPTELLDKHFG